MIATFTARAGADKRTAVSAFALVPTPPAVALAYDTTPSWVVVVANAKHAVGIGWLH
jgi:hypothetical protein